MSHSTSFLHQLPWQQSTLMTIQQTVVSITLHVIDNQSEISSAHWSLSNKTLFLPATRLQSTCFPHVVSTDSKQQDCAFAIDSFISFASLLLHTQLPGSTIDRFWKRATFQRIMTSITTTTTTAKLEEDFKNIVAEFVAVEEERDQLQEDLEKKSGIILVLEQELNVLNT